MGCLQGSGYCIRLDMILDESVVVFRGLVLVHRYYSVCNSNKLELALLL